MYLKLDARSIFITLSLLLCINSVGATESEPRERLTLAMAIKQTLSLNPQLKVFGYRQQALDGLAQTAGLSPAMEIGVELENVLGTGEARGIGGAELTVALSSVLEMGDKRAARSQVVSSSRAVLDAQKLADSLDLLGDVTRRYIDVLAAQSQISLALEAQELASSTLDIVKKRVEAGAAPKAEEKRATAALGQAQLTLLSELQRLDYLHIALAALWGETNPQFSQVEGELFRFGTDTDFESLYAKVQRNPAIQVFASEQRLRDTEVRLAETQSTGDISWSVGARRLQGSRDTALVAGFSMPLFSSKRNSGAVSTALAQRNEVSVQREVALLNMYSQLYRAYHNRKQAILSAEALQNTIIPALEQALNETQSAYQRGRYGYLEYISAKQELLNARRTSIEAAFAALTYGAEIEQLTAVPLAASSYQFSGSTQ
ncbi:TolC family protein [Paraglaciecola arctica]|uniref:Outer membrane efflux protein n=1 Tax=Paraglaciecola arctica BSs20135 TaxID=493475 RepID=K6YMT4_9ALTE|nr:TolC family protein [Paraglaciecola arctica]GAC19492.1 hypothetical protein GARC_2526 [Paraglaciecola arctica BSs20135]